MAHVTQAQFAALPVVADANLAGPAPGLQSGDILIHHKHSGTGAWDNKGFHASTVAIQTTIDFTAVILYDSMGGVGIRSKMWPDFHDECTVFRPWGVGTPADAGAAAGLQAEAFRAAGVGYSSFGVGRAILCGLGGKKFGTGAKGRLTKYHGRTTPVPKNCVCSEFVVLCYQMALAEGDDHFIKLDAKFTTPWNLLSYLLKNIHWTLVGAAKGRPR
jgi:hypothetical protein